MRTRSLWLLFCFTCLLASLGAEQRLLQQLAKAQPGEFAVASQGGYTSVWLVKEREEDLLAIEEISMPRERFRGAPSWREWVERGGPGHTSWTVYLVATGTGQILDQFSYTTGCWRQPTEGESLLPTLLNLPLQSVPLENRPRVGKALRGQPDNRPFWQPRMVVEGKAQPSASFSAWRGQWPADGSYCSGKEVEIYLPKEDPRYPTYFPYWMQVKGLGSRGQLRVVDAGSALQSPKPPFLRRGLTFLNSGRFEEGQLRLWVRRRPYQSDLLLSALDNTGDAAAIPLSYGIRPTEQVDVVILEVPLTTLQKKLVEGHKYRFRIQPLSRPGLGTETGESLVWSVGS